MRKTYDLLVDIGFWLTDHPKSSMFLAGMALGFGLRSLV